MNSYKIVFCDTNESLLSDAIEFFRDDAEVELLPYRSTNGLFELDVESVQGLIIDSNFPGIRELISLYRDKGIKIVVTANFPTVDEVAPLDVYFDLLFYQPYSLAELRMKLVYAIRQQEMLIRMNKGKNIDERLSSIFIRAGIPPHVKGYQFLRESVKIVLVHPEMINSITKDLYPTVAKLYNTSSSKVERAIRHAIEVAWSRGKIENINAVFGIKIYNKGEKPTNGELIALVADKLMIETL